MSKTSKNVSNQNQIKNEIASSLDNNNVNSNLEDIFNKVSDEDDDLDRLVACYIDNQNPPVTDLNNNSTNNNQCLIESMMLEDDDFNKHYYPSASCNTLSEQTNLNTPVNSFQNFINQNNHLLIKDDDDDEEHEHDLDEKNEEDDEDGDEEEDDEEEYDEQTHITTLHEFI